MFIHCCVLVDHVLFAQVDAFRSKEPNLSYACVIVTCKCLQSIDQHTYLHVLNMIDICF